MTDNRYFRDELAFLKEQGKAFADIHPKLSRYLNGPNADPDVERLLEGFAFLTGRIREKVDDEFPELTHSIINMLWPNYLRPVPSLTIVQFTPVEKTFGQAQVIEKGTQLEANSKLGTSCQFRTCRDIVMYPMVLGGVHSYQTRDAAFIELNLINQNGDSFSSLALSTLRFYLGGDEYSAQMLYLWLNHYLIRLEIVLDDKVIYHPLGAIKPVGFTESDTLLPYPTNVYQGYRILQEYLCFSEGFLFFDIEKLARSIPAAAKEELVIRFCFSKNLPPDVRIRAESFSLYCTPAINLFVHDIDPIDMNGKSVEYPIKPSGRFASHYELFSLDKVQGWVETQEGRVRGQARIYTPFESFQHEIERVSNRQTLYYRLRVKNAIKENGFAHYLSFIRGDETACVGLTEAISLEATCTNRDLPLELGKDDICIPTDTCPSFATFTNITAPTASLRPVLDGTLLWILISNLSLNYLSLLSKDALSSLLRAYDFKALLDRQAELASKHRLEGILAIDTKPIEKLFKGLPVRGLRSEISLQQSAFSCEGDLYLFGTILSQFFSLYVSINSFHELIVINADNQERYSWDIQTGSQPLL